ncbi:MAG: DUF4160 domain-containing protein [Leptolyngbya sp. LCM1.Bin17]|nr:MAG: DUF4160 domain-containing protein [Leptolyngbya sp. LCM1.Bin17]
MVSETLEAQFRIVALISIESLEIIEGDLPNRAQKMVIDWAQMYQKDLLAMWETQEFRKLPPLK